MRFTQPKFLHVQMLLRGDSLSPGWSGLIPCIIVAYKSGHKHPAALVDATFIDVSG
jgi:hypothetical protein